MSEMAKGTAVDHETHGRGRVVIDEGDAVVVRFDSGILSCVRDDLRVLPDLSSKDGMQAGPPLRVLARTLGCAIQSVNDTWGVFSNSRIDLLPHQLWVCRRVLEKWPARWLVADDVGLGKTIEAGLILTPLLSSGRVRRLMVLVPAALVEQWQLRLREMFDIRLARYTAAADTAKSDFWGTNAMVIASAQTVRTDHKGRWKRLLEAPPWDMILVDEAHHVNHDERSGSTLAWELIDSLQTRGKIVSMVFFTGTPHRGKDFGFLSLLKLLRPDTFDPSRPMDVQIERLREVMIRNNKRRVTDMQGRLLFQRVTVDWEQYHYSPSEQRFYDLLTEYIATGKAYASQLASSDQRTAILVLIAMQKLASSSVAAIRRALAGRLERLTAAEIRREQAIPRVAEIKAQLEAMSWEDEQANADLRSQLEEEFAEKSAECLLGPEEIPAIHELLAAADEVGEETKIRRIADLVDERFAGRSVLFFTEYKATQALIMSALRARYGEDCVTFINGDGRIHGVRDAHGEETTLVASREDAARRFNDGLVRFLVSTEAAGEGVDLQRRCFTLVHVDLPWNPMRLHQRVGRIDRYGQQHPVEVLSIQNPDTVEGRIWECLRAKLDRITQAFGAAMDDPEDMLQLVLGMSSPGEMNRLFAEANEVPTERLKDWFDEKSATFGGRKAIEVVRDLIGNVARFDFGTEKAGLPAVDLPDLVPFFRMAVTLGARRIEERDGGVDFITPEEWEKADFALLPRYEGLRFRRERPGESSHGEVCGVGHRVFDAALAAVEKERDVLAVVPGLTRPLAVFVVRDAVTTGTGIVRKTVFAVEGELSSFRLLQDWELITYLNVPGRRVQALSRASAQRAGAGMGNPQNHMEAAQTWLTSILPSQQLPFRFPRLDPFVLLLPASTENAEDVTESR